MKLHTKLIINAKQKFTESKQKLKKFLLRETPATVVTSQKVDVSSKGIKGVGRWLARWRLRNPLAKRFNSIEERVKGVFSPILLSKSQRDVYIRWKTTLRK